MTVVGVVIYMAIAGWQPSIIRAGIMAILAMVGLILGRQRDAKWLLILTGAAMLIVNPKLISDIGFQLSFAATWGILFISPPVNRVEPRPGPNGQGSTLSVLGADLKTTLAAQAMTTPLILHHFGNLSVPVVDGAAHYANYGGGNGVGTHKLLGLAFVEGPVVGGE